VVITGRAKCHYSSLVSGIIDYFESFIIDHIVPFFMLSFFATNNSLIGIFSKNLRAPEYRNDIRGLGRLICEQYRG